jgi:hypothetical protein
MDPCEAGQLEACAQERIAEQERLLSKHQVREPAPPWSLMQAAPRARR